MYILKTPKWNTRFFFAFSKITQLKKWENSFKTKVAIAKFVWKIKNKFWYYEKWVGVMPLFLLDDLLKLLKKLYL